MKKAPSVSRRGFVAVTLLSLFYCSARDCKRAIANQVPNQTV
ncbi:hypothetical protein VVMO6_03875 [Vibrio vulnificus MO6-24/O]|nr:hypothetical protein VVMO6_03875 [Vibrio vulnificus MO6-24/O]